MNKKEIYLLYVTDAWHTKSSMQLLGVFDDYELIFTNYLNDILKEEYLKQLRDINQTQGLDPNYIILTEKLNPKL